MPGHSGTPTTKRPCLRMQNLRQANTNRKATANFARGGKRETSLSRKVSSQKLVHSVSAMLRVKVPFISTDGLSAARIILWNNAAGHRRVIQKLRREADANPGNAGMRPGATGLTSRRGIWLAVRPSQAQSDKCAPSPERSDGEGGGKGLIPRKEWHPKRPGAVCRAVDPTLGFTSLD